MATASSPADYEHPARQSKLALIETAHRITEFQSFADLGGCWGVNGAYSFHAAELCGPTLERAFVLDGNITPQTRDRANQHPKIELLADTESVYAGRGWKSRRGFFR